MATAVSQESSFRSEASRVLCGHPVAALLQKLETAVRKRFGGTDLLMNNAGISRAARCSDRQAIGSGSFQSSRRHDRHGRRRASEQRDTHLSKDGRDRYDAAAARSAEPASCFPRKRTSDVLKGTFRSLANANYRIWAAGAVISNVGTWMQRTAQDWIVLTELTHHNSTAMGIVMGLQFGPQILRRLRLRVPAQRAAGKVF